jgi:phosphoglycolate phosphatase
VKYKLIIFDFDGTLADSFPWLISIINVLAEEYHFKTIKEDDLKILRTYKAPQIMNQLGISIWKAPKIGKEIKIRMSREIQRVPLFEGTREMLQELFESGLKLAVVSSNARANILHVLDETAGHIHFFVCDVALNGKRASYRKILTLSGLQPHEVLCIGDEIRDLTASHREEIDFGAVSWGYTDIETLKGHSPELVFTKPREILAFFQDGD